MPHAELKGPVTPEDVWLSFEPLQFHENDCHLKVTDAYLAHDKQMVLLRSTVVEKNFARNYFMKLHTKGERLVLCLEPLGFTERTDAVKRLLGLCVWTMMQVEPQLELVNTNVEQFISSPKD